MPTGGVVRVAAIAFVLALLATACPNGDGEDETSVFDDVRSRGELVCGVNDGVPGFGFREADGSFSGFDVEFCRAVAAGVLGEADNVNFVPLEAGQRFTALQGREIDVLIRNTTWTASRDGTERASFAMTTFYDGQGMMVTSESGIDSLEGLAGATICVLSGTTTELNLETQMAARGLAYTPLSLPNNDQIQSAFTDGRCQGWTADQSALAGLRAAWPAGQGGPDALTVLEVTMSKEPLGPVTRDGDTTWFDAVNWVVIATIQAEEFGITSQNVDQVREQSEDPDVQRFLGVTPAGADPFASGLALPDDFAYQVIRQVGNYAEIYERNVGPDTALGLPRGINALWTDGGLLYPPPYR